MPTAAVPCTRGGWLSATALALGVGWWWGASARGDLERALRTAEIENDLLEARLSLLGARVSLSEADFAGVTRLLQQARDSIDRAGQRPAVPDEERSAPLILDGIRADVDEAQHLAAILEAARRTTPAR